MPDQPARHDLEARLLGAIRSYALTEDEFETLAFDVFRYQFAKNSIYRRYCEARGATPDSVTSLLAIPALPTDAFKAAPLVTGDPANAEAVFRTSGTTQGETQRGSHYFPDTRIYRAALRAGFRRHLLPGGERLAVYGLVPPFTDAPDSSLSFMISDVVAELGAAGSGFFVDAGGVRTRELIDALREAEGRGIAVLLAGTSFAFVHLLDALVARGERVRLAEGSRVMDTGGFKGRLREVGRGELYTSIGELLGVPVAYAVNEYGMTEMSSQFYDGIAGSAGPVETRCYVGPPWVRTVAADPETLNPVGAGTAGVLRHFDLANLDSVMALQTADVGVVVAGGFELRGRAGGAEARGCSLAMEALLATLGKR